MSSSPRHHYARQSLLIAVTIAVATLSNVAPAAAPVVRDRQTADVTGSLDHEPLVVDARLHRAGNLRLGVSNDGRYGQPFLTSPVPVDATIELPINTVSRLFEFPSGSYAIHMFGAGLWIGGVVDGDTLVSTAMDGLSVEKREFSAFDSMRVSSSLPGSEFFSTTAISQDQFDCVYTDTLPVNYSDELDNRLHYPIGVEVSQTTHAWLSEPFDDFTIVVNTIRNITDEMIYGLRFGVCSDADVYRSYPSSVRETGRFWDDVSGYLNDHAIAYTIDNDGDPLGDTLWDSVSVRSAYAVVPIAITPEPCCTTFNWWGLSPSDVYPFGSLEPGAPPRGDRWLYRTMASDSIEGDQLFVAANGSGLPPNPRNPYGDLADGIDTRFLLSFGAYDLQPGDSVRFVYAYVAGDSVHQDPANFAANFDAEFPQVFYDHLYFGDLIRNVEAARFAYDNGFDLIGAAPPQVTFMPISDRTVEIHWVAAPFKEVAGYRIYRRATGHGGDWEKVGETIGANIHYFTDRELSLRLTYEYTIAAVGTDGQEGVKSHPLAYKAGLPTATPGIDVVGEKMDVTVNWSVDVPKTTFAPPEHINIYRRTESEPPVLIATISAIASQSSSKQGTTTPLAAGLSKRYPMRPSPRLLGSFRDTEVESGVEYWYSASVTNTLGFEGAQSEEARAVPMAMDRPGVVIVDRYRSASVASVLINEDSAQAFYFDWARSAGFDTALYRHGFEQDYLVIPGTYEYPTDVLPLLSKYETVVVASDGISITSLPEFLAGLEDHLARGGRSIWTGRRLPWRYGADRVERSGGRDIAEFSDESYPRRVFGIKRVISEVPTIVDRTSDLFPVFAWSVEFSGGATADPSYPDLEPDSTQATTILSEWTGDRLPIYGGGLIPDVGALLEFDNANVIYTYEAGFPDTSALQGLPVAIRSTNPDKRFVLFGIPLSQMKRDAAFTALNAALTDLGVAPTTFEPFSRTVTAQRILDYMYGEKKQAPNPAFDTNGDGVIDLRDAVHAIDDK